MGDYDFYRGCSSGELDIGYDVGYRAGYRAAQNESDAIYEKKKSDMKFMQEKVTEANINNMLRLCVRYTIDPFLHDVGYQFVADCAKMLLKMDIVIFEKWLQDNLNSDDFVIQIGDKCVASFKEIPEAYAVKKALLHFLAYWYYARIHNE